MRLSSCLGLVLLTTVSAVSACGNSSSGEPVGQAGSSSGSGGAAAGSAGGPTGVSGSQSTSGSGGSTAGSGGTTAGAGGASGGTSGGAGHEGGASGQGGVVNDAGASGEGGAASDPCGGCDVPDEVCVYQTGGPGASRFTCAAQLPCGAPGACACIVDQGQCEAERMGDPPGYCVCDNGLD
jgi:hypothetical protein